MAKKRVASKAELEEFFNGVSRIEYKNSGGCLFFCYAFYLWLKKNKYDTTSFAIKQYDAIWNKGNIGHNLDFINGKNNNVVSSTHFTWLYDNKEYDAEGFPILYTRTDSYKFCDFDVESFCENALINGDWNEMFDRNKAIKQIQKTFGIEFPASISESQHVN